MLASHRATSLTALDCQLIEPVVRSLDSPKIGFSTQPALVLVYACLGDDISFPTSPQDQ